MLRFAGVTTPEEVRMLEDRILAVAMERGADQLRQARMLLVLDEILTNIRLYAYPDAPGPVRVDVLPQVGDEDTFLHLRLHDWGPPFNPLLETPPPDVSGPIEQRPVGGLGLHLVYNMVCGLRYERVWEEPPSEGRNQLSLSFPLLPPKGRG